MFRYSVLKKQALRNNYDLNTKKNTIMGVFCCEGG